MIKKKGLYTLGTVLVLFIIISGCLDLGKKDNPKIYKEPADDYILTESEVGNEWSMNDDHKFDSESPSGLDTRYQSTFTDDSGNSMIIGVWVMNDIESCQLLYDDTKLDFTSLELKGQDLEVGDDALGYADETEAMVITRISNVMVLIYCEDALLSFVKNMALEQINKIKE